VGDTALDTISSIGGVIVLVGIFLVVFSNKFIRQFFLTQRKFTVNPVCAPCSLQDSVTTYILVA